MPEPRGLGTKELYEITSHGVFGNITGAVGGFHYTEDAMLPGCNAGFDAEKAVYYKTASGGTMTYGGSVP